MHALDRERERIWRNFTVRPDFCYEALMMSRGGRALLVVSAGALLIGVACTRNNLEYNPFGSTLDGGGGGNVDFGGRSVDLGGGGGGRDLASGCAIDTRVCQGSSSVACLNGALTVDRTCPSASMCVDGYCEAPPQGMFTTEGRPCDFNGAPTESACVQGGSSEFSCQPFVADPVDQTIDWVCARAIGMKGRGDACTKGSECRSGFCGDNGTCFRACAGDRDCQSTMQKCADVKIVVEGIEVQAKSCIPR